MIDLIVATADRREELGRLLDSLCAQTYREFRVIIIDQNPVGFLESTLAPYAKKLDMVVRRVDRVGASAARNIGISLVKDAEIVGFPDDDCWYEPTTLERLKEFLIPRDEIGAVIGRWKKCKREQVDRRKVFYQAGTCFYFVRASWVRRIGGFDEELGPGGAARFIGAEDTDYLLRGMRSGMVIMREPSIRIHHPDMPKGRASSDKVRGYARARMELLRRHHYPLWFRLANVIYPIVRMLGEPWKARYFLDMFTGRVSGL